MPLAQKDVEQKLAQLEEISKEGLAIISELRETTGPEPGSADKRQAALLASEAAKGLLQIAVAVFVAAAGLLQFFLSRGVSLTSLPTALLAVTFVLLFVSMGFGFSAISGLYKRGEGRITREPPSWSTSKVGGRLDVQSYTGILALLFLIAAIAAASTVSRPGDDEADGNASGAARIDSLVVCMDCATFDGD